MDLPAQEISCDTLFDGELYCYQHKKGYRFSIDSVLLAHFTRVKKRCRLLDLGTGCGIVSLLLRYRHADSIDGIVCLEYQPELAALARDNVERNNFSQHCRVLQGDVRDINDFIVAESFDTVVCNPPFYRLGHGRTSRDEETFLSRHQTAGTIEDFLRAAAYSLKNRGMMYLIYPAEQMVECLCAARKYRLEAKRVRSVYSYPEDGSEASLVLFCFSKNGGVRAEIPPPLFVYSKKNGPYSAEVAQYYLKNQDLRQ